jgi:hypothetical protein
MLRASSVFLTSVFISSDTTDRRDERTFLRGQECPLVHDRVPSGSPNG